MKNIGLNGANVRVSVLNQPVSSVGQFLCGGIALTMAMRGKDGESRRVELRHNLDGLVIGAVLPAIKNGHLPGEQGQNVYDALRQAYIFGYGGDETTAKRHGLYKRPAFKALQTAFGVDKRGRVIQDSRELGQDVVNIVDRVTIDGFSKFVIDSGLVGIEQIGGARQSQPRASD